MTNEQLIELINELFDVSERDDEMEGVVLCSKRVGLWRFERFAQRVRNAAIMELADRIDAIVPAIPRTPVIEIGDVMAALRDAIEGKTNGD